MDEFNSSNNGPEPENNGSVNLSKEDNSQGSYQMPQDNNYQPGQNNYSNPQDNAGRTAYGQPGYYENNNSGYNPSGTGYTQPQSGYDPNAYNQNSYNQGYNQNNYDMNNPNNYGYGYQDPYGGYRRQPSQGLAIGSLVCGIIGLSSGIMGWVFPLLFLLPIVGLVLGIVHKVKYPGFAKGMSIAGIILSAIGIILPFVFIIAMIAYLPELMEYVQQVDPDMYQEFYDEYAEELPGMFSAVFTAFKSLIIK